MNFVISLLIIGGAAFYIVGRLQTDVPVLNLYVTWITTLIALNLLVSLFIYSFTHNVKNSRGNQGIRGKVGRRGNEGDPDFCNFCIPTS